MLYVRIESISRHLNRQMDFVYEFLFSLFMFVMYVNHSCMGSTKNKHTIKIIIIYIISYDIYSILICQYHSYLTTLLTNFKLYINIHNKYHLMIISFMECVISHKNEYYQIAGRTCKICKLKSVCIVLHYLSILFLLVILHRCYIYIYRFITVYILRRPLVVLLVSLQYLQLHTYNLVLLGGSPQPF